MILGVPLKAFLPTHLLFYGVNKSYLATYSLVLVTYFLVVDLFFVICQMLLNAFNEPCEICHFLSTGYGLIVIIVIMFSLL